MTTTPRQRMALIAALGAIAIVCLPPSTGPLLSPTFDPCIVCGQNGLASALLNVVLYLPYGAALWRRFRRPLPVAVAALGTSLLVEVLQLGIPGRHAALSDLLANVLGAGIGAGLAVRPRAWLLPRGRAAHAATVVMGLAVALTMVLAATLLEPAAPDGTYYAQWTPSGRNRPAYDGRVVDARLGSVVLGIGEIPARDSLRTRILAGTPVIVRFVVGTPPDRLLPVLRLVAGEFNAGDEALQVGVDGPHLVLTPRFRADDYRLSRPEVQLEGALAGAAVGDTVTVRLSPGAVDGYVVEVDDASARIGFTVGHAWSLLYATDLRSHRLLRAMDLTWLAGLGLLVAWFAATLRRTVPVLGACAVLAATLPAMSRLLPTPSTEYVALAAGAAVGLLARRWADGRSAAAPQRLDGAHTS